MGQNACDLLLDSSEKNVHGNNKINNKEQQSQCGKMWTDDDCRENEANSWCSIR